MYYCFFICSRQIEITIDLLFEGACFGKCLFSLEAIDAAIPDIRNIPILAEDGSYGVGVIPESAGSRWTKLLVGLTGIRLCTVDRV